MEPPTNHAHVWVKTINSMAEICQICHCLKNPITGEIEPPNPNITNPPLIQEQD